MDLGDLGVGESGRFAPTFTHPIHSPELCHFDAAPAAGEIYSKMSSPHYVQKILVKSQNKKDRVVCERGKFIYKKRPEITPA